MENKEIETPQEISSDILRAKTAAGIAALTKAIAGLQEQSENLMDAKDLKLSEQFSASIKSINEALDGLKSSIMGDINKDILASKQEMQTVTKDAAKSISDIKTEFEKKGKELENQLVEQVQKIKTIFGLISEATSKV